jgi:8-oxo-dGTP pyrophosphatase MutT (NUDIX family)
MGEASGFLDATGAPFHGMPDGVSPGAAAVIFNGDGDVLLEKRSDNGFWGLPGGRVDAGESLEQAAIREVLEETGLHVTVKRLVGVYSDPRLYSIMVYPDGAAMQGIIAVFECERVGGDLRVSPESTDVRYFSVEALPDDTLPAHLLRIRDALTGRDAAFIR